MHGSRIAKGLVLMAGFTTSVQAAEPIQISGLAWAGLTGDERELIQKRFLVNLAEPESYGVIIDNQGADESTPGNNAGSALGAAVANAAYVDKAINSGNYSAKNQLAVGLLGAIIGSSLNQAPQSRFHFRYAVKLGTGQVQYFDAISSEPFRHPAGVCVTVPIIALADQNLCSQTPAMVRAQYLASRPEPSGPQPAAPPLRSDKDGVVASAPSHESSALTIQCKVGALAPVTTTREKCLRIGGEVQ